MDIIQIIKDKLKFTGLKMFNKNSTFKQEDVKLLVLDNNNELVTILMSDIIGSGSLTPVSATESGIVNNILLQELGGIDKLINTVRIGKGAGTSTESTALGTDVLGVNTIGDFNTGVGFQVLKANTTGRNNTGVGDWALYSNTVGISNTAVGTNAGYLITTGTHNSILGASAGSALTTGVTNTYIGASAGNKATTGNGNMGVGSNALAKLVTGGFNTACGGGQNITGSFNTVMGYLAVGFTGVVSSGDYNIVIGYQAGRDLTTGHHNLLMENILNASITSGNYNIVLNPVQRSGVTTGSNNTIIGGFNETLAAGLMDTVAIGTGLGVMRFLSNTAGLNTIPTQTNALIIADVTGKAIATKEYVDAGGAVVNATVVALTAANLNSAYPNALLGFRVICMSIAGGGLVYMKTTGGWISQTATAVA